MGLAGIVNNCLQDRTKFHRSHAWRIVIILTLYDIWTYLHLSHPVPQPNLTHIPRPPQLTYFGHIKLLWAFWIEKKSSIFTQEINSKTHFCKILLTLPWVSELTVVCSSFRVWWEAEAFLKVVELWPCELWAGGHCTLSEGLDFCLGGSGSCWVYTVWVGIVDTDLTH